MPTPRLTRLALSLALLGCAGSTDENGSFATANDSSGETEDEVGDATGTESDSGDEGPRLDVSPDDGGDAAGCEKVDFLFIVDNSGSMLDEQQKLAAAFPGFIDVIQDTLQAQDYQIMVIDTDGFDEPGGTYDCGGNDPDCCDEICAKWAPDTCNQTECPDLSFDEVCSGRLGGGRVTDGAGTSCGIAGDRRYMVDGQPDVEATFACLTDVGLAGYGVEKPMDALGWGMSEALQGPGGCNEGFLRDDAILVVTLISDEEDRKLKSEGDPPDWYEALVTAKGGNPESIVVLGIVGDELDYLCDDGNFSQDAPRLRHFVSLFGERGITASICEQDFLPFFLDAVETIDLTCEQFEPEG